MKKEENPPSPRTAVRGSSLLRLHPRTAVRGLAIVFCSLCFFVANSTAAEPWATYRGNPQRTAADANSPGPAAPKVLWALKSQDHFIASPLPYGDNLYVSGLGAFNVSNFACLSADPKAAKRTAWSKTTPYLKLPTVSSPAVADGKLIFGDGMHQTDGAILHCLKIDKGMPLWQLPVPGTLVHLEGSPTVEKGVVYLGGGAAGVMAIDPSHVTLDGKEIELPAAQKILDMKWAELVTKYEADKKKDADFAVPPNDDQLPKPKPTLLWQQGKERWHVDAPVNVIGERVLVASAFLYKEGVGDRAVFCLNAKTGDVMWRTPLKINPWGGPSVQGDLVIVTGSTIGYDPRILKDAKGAITALNLADGSVKWTKEVPGGIEGCAALADGKAIVTATDGKVRAFNLADGERAWIADLKTPFFAPPAIGSGGTVFAADLKGGVHSLDLGTGKVNWSLDLGTHPDIKAPGMVYGGPALSGGRLFVATCNLEGPTARQPTVVVCIGEK